MPGKVLSRNWLPLLACKGGRRRSNIYEISYESDSPDRVYQVVSNLLNTMIENTLSSTRTDTMAAQKFLDVQIAEYERRLTIAEQNMVEFKKANFGFMPDEKGGYYARLKSAQDRKIVPARRYAWLSDGILN